MHTFLALDMDLIPQLTKDNTPRFWDGRISNDGSRMLIPAYDDSRNLVHVSETFDSWLAGVSDKEKVFNKLINTGIEYTKQQIKQMESDTNSIWYIDQESE